MNQFDMMIAGLKNTSDPIVIYGAKLRAEKIKSFLSGYGITVSGYIVDKAYYTEGMTFDGVRVYAAEDYLESHRCSVVVAFKGLSVKRENDLRTNRNVTDLWLLDFLGRFAIEGDNLITAEYYDNNRALFEETREMLSEGSSREAFDDFINQRLTGAYRKNYSSNPQYFDEDVVKFDEDEVLVDCGAYNGDSALAFIEALGKQGVKGCRRIYAFEADCKNVEAMEKNLSAYDNIEIVGKGVWDSVTELRFSNSGSTSSSFSDDGVVIPVTTIDEVCAGQEVTFIKMDIEGSELKALRGAENTIRRCRPKLAVCVYHRKEDLITIPQYIRSLNPDYRFEFRNYSSDSLESVLYAL